MKYFKPRSLTWWASVVPMAGGVFIALEPMHGMGGVADSVSNLLGNVQPYILINAGLAGIGFRGAIK
ncbi:MAG: hypothetical protein JKY32_07135 [Rhizobiales bacterium]|nr:hypothetical protein [Hyphomicrobiales bacterium]